LEDLFAAFGDRRISLIRELTKIHEEVILTNLANAVSLYSEDHPPRGEYVLVVEGATKAAEAEMNQEADALALARRLIQGGMPLMAAAKEAAGQKGVSKNKLYKSLLEAEGK